MVYFRKELLVSTQEGMHWKRENWSGFASGSAMHLLYISPSLLQGNNAVFQYAFQNSLSVPFAINPFTGDITVNTDATNTLDYDAGTQTYVFQVIYDDIMTIW